jgi:hyperosmotically inducible periplasmic protein
MFFPRTHQPWPIRAKAARNGKLLPIALWRERENMIVSTALWVGHSRANHAGMHLSSISKAIASALLLGSSIVMQLPAQSTDAQTKPDNSAVNKRDKDPGAVTADQQKMNAADREIAAKIRKSVMADKSLSTYAHNVKIISQDGTVTLKGPVRSEAEVTSIMAKAADVTGSSDKVVNQMSVAPASK